MAIGRISSDKVDFWQKMDIAYPKFGAVPLCRSTEGCPDGSRPKMLLPMSLRSRCSARQGQVRPRRKEVRSAERACGKTW
jgi:hypothetical protein